MVPCPAGPILVVVAHCDDEVIGAGAHLADWAVPFTLLHVTDSAPADGVDAAAAGCATVGAYAAARRREWTAALNYLPQPPRELLTLDIRDREATDHLLDLIASLRECISRLKPAVVVTHSYEGGHPDHDAVAFAISAVRSMRDVPPFSAIEFAAYHESESGLVTNRFADGLVAGARLPPALRELKQTMLECFTTQRRVLASFDCEYESLRRAGSSDFSAPPVSGRIWYERLGWGLTGATWRATIRQVAERLAAEGLTC